MYIFFLRTTNIAHIKGDFTLIKTSLRLTLLTKEVTYACLQHNG